jgi:DNA-binding transcriptional regulator YhcF (GntR family)
MVLLVVERASHAVLCRELTTLVTDQIRDLIISDRLALGEQLSEQDLSEQLGVSRPPVREAFQRLENGALGRDTSAKGHLCLPVRHH